MNGEDSIGNSIFGMDDLLNHHAHQEKCNGNHQTICVPHEINGKSKEKYKQYNAAYLYAGLECLRHCDKLIFL